MTRKMMLIAGVAGMAVTVPALAQKGERGGGQERKQEQQAQPQQQRGGGGQRAERPQRAEQPQMQRAERPQRAERQMQRMERPQRAERQMQRMERPQQMQRAGRPQRMERQMQRMERPQRVERQQQRAERQMQRMERPQRLERQQQRAERPQRLERQQQRVERQAQRPERQQQRVDRQAQRFERQAARPERQQERFERQAQRQQQRIERSVVLDRGQRLERRDMIRQARQNIRQDVRQENRQQQRFQRRAAEQLFAPIDRQVAYRTAKFDGRGYRPLASVFASREMIPMQSFNSVFDDRRAFISVGDRYDTGYNWSPVPSFYGSRYFDTDDYYYRYNPDYGYAYRIDRGSNLISSFYPLFGGYGIGDPWPQTYYSSYVPVGYRDYYYDTPDYYYRNDGYGIYQVDAGTQLITALVSLVLGQSYGVGQALPLSYSTYNVPLDYRGQYADTDDRWYRYGDGFIYEVNPRNRVVAARYPLYSDDYYVGERWPVAYPDYNVPYAYRDQYADSPQYHYRYANGGIYQVDPTNQLILALAALVSGDQFAVGQPMPSGYDIYNVPVDYRDRWADSDDEYFRYANGYVYRIDDDSGLIEEAFPVYDA